AATLVPLTAASPSAHARATHHAHHRLVAGKHVLQLHRRHAGANQQSLNWSGYIRTGHAFGAASGSWRVPKLASGNDGYSSTWVGVDGATSNDRYLIQTGTEADVVGGRASY